jgi:glycosyltransferase involved in cell wall biosynthesis
MTSGAADTRPRLLFISPAYPDTEGNGLAMRAGMFIEALAQRYRVSLLVAPLFDWRRPSSEALVAQYCQDVRVVRLRPEGGVRAGIGRRLDGRPGLMRLFARQAEACIEALGDARFDVVHAFRLYTAPIALRVASSRREGHPRLHLDIDDVESSTRARMSELYALNGRTQESAIEAREGRRFAAAEGQMLPRFDRVYVCSGSDATRIGHHVRGEVLVVPNTVRAPQAPSTPLTTHPFTFLFVGTLGYFPNQDAVLWFCREVLPLLRAQAPAAFRVRVVGAGMAPALAALAQHAEVRLVGEVPDVGPEYAEADAVIVPIRGGGGTRIKILEAFGYQRPVVTTSIGVEGIEAAPERHVLVGDTANAFASQCLRLMQDRDLRDALAASAYELVLAQYSQARTNQRFSDML